MTERIYNKKFKLIICIGYPKTGTTYFQNFIFNKIKNINYVGIESKKFDPDLYNIRKSIIKNCDENFQEKLPYLKKIFKQKLKKNSINLYSDEHFLNPSTLGYERTVKRLNKFLEEFNKRLTVIVFIRKQSNLILSNYKETAFVKKFLKISSFNELLIKLKNNSLSRNDKFFLEQYNFKKLKKYLTKNLSRKIIFYDYEDFNKNNIRFIINFLKKHKFKMRNNIELTAINQNKNIKNQIKTKYNVEKLNSKKWFIFIKESLINILPLKIRFFLKDKILLNIFSKKEEVKFELLNLIDDYYKKKRQRG